MTLFLFSMSGLAAGLVIAFRIYQDLQYLKILQRMVAADANYWREQYKELFLESKPPQPRDKSGRFVSRKDLMTQQLIKELNHG